MKYSSIKIDIPYWRGFRESYETRNEEYDAVYERMSDDVSQKTYKSLIALKYDLDVSGMDMFDASPENQYFEPFLNLAKDNEVFVDLGGFDGANTEYFAEHYSGYKKVYYFEPEPTIMEDAKKRLSKYPNIDFFQVAASNENGTIKFASDSAASKISDEGDIEVRTAKLDDLLGRDVTFLKMDVEGAESACIEGSRDIIKTCHPRLAICVYHKGADFVDIPKQIFDIRSDYKLYMRHYSEGICDTVMFFIPE